MSQASADSGRSAAATDAPAPDTLASGASAFERSSAVNVAPPAASSVGSGSNHSPSSTSTSGVSVREKGLCVDASAAIAGDEGARRRGDALAAPIPDLKGRNACASSATEPNRALASALIARITTRPSSAGMVERRSLGETA